MPLQFSKHNQLGKRVKKPVKGLNRVKKTPLAALKRQADKLAGDACRFRGSCEACGGKDRLQWAHVIRRGYHSLRWLPQNCLCLCASCHYKFTVNPELWIEFLIDNYADTYRWLTEKRKEHVKINREFMELVIEDLKKI